MSDVVHVLGIAGSLRAHSTNKGLLRCARRFMPEGSVLEIADLSAVPLFNVDVEAQGKPPAVERLVNQAVGADALVLACPEYNYSMAPALKNALDWLSREPENRVLAGKAVAIMGAGGGMGTARAQYHLRQTCVYLDLHPLNKPELFAHALSGSFNGEGDVADDELAGRVTILMSALLAWHWQLKQAKG